MSNQSKIFMSGISESFDKIMKLHVSWASGQNPWVTIENSNPEERNKKRIKVKARDLWGIPGMKFTFEKNKNEPKKHVGNPAAAITEALVEAGV